MLIQSVVQVEGPITRLLVEKEIRGAGDPVMLGGRRTDRERRPYLRNCWQRRIHGQSRGGGRGHVGER
jgi:hypothetical protein